LQRLSAFGLAPALAGAATAPVPGRW